ncbi:MAG TPA: hypothetical protein VFJ16_03665 [Longimicrobium sp.]|nr:hypothetical protein [Longimicrobium sp.]
MEAPAFRSRTVPEVLDAGFQMIRGNYGQLAVLALVLASPALVLQFFLAGTEAQRVVDLVQGLMGNYVTAATVVVVSEAYLGRSIETGDVLRRVGERFGSIWSAAWIRGFLLIFGLLLLVIPGIIAMIVTFAMPIVVMLEGASASESFDRSRALSKQNWGRIAFTLGLTVLMQYLGLFGGGVVLTVLFGPSVTSLMLVQVLVALLAPFPAVVGTVLYYDLRIRKEGFDIQMLMEAMEPTRRKMKFAF